MTNSETTKKFKSVSSSRMAKETFNPIRNILETIDLKPNPKKKMISLSIGDPTVFGNLRPHSSVVEAVHKSLESGNYNGYASSTGFPEARAAIAKHVNKSAPDVFSLTEEDVVICSGCSCSLDFCISVLCNPGDNILIPRPGFPLYGTLAKGLGIETREYNLLPELHWEADLDHLESLIDERTKAIVVNNPSNPCGSVFSKEHLLQILEIAEAYEIPIIADEIYDHFVFPGQKYIPIASLTKTVPVLSCGGLTKRFLVPGWRLGWITIHDNENGSFHEVKAGLKSLSQRIIGANTIVQGAIPAILENTPEHFFSETIETIRRNAELAYDQLSKVPGLHPVMPQGAMYMMVRIDAKMFESNFKNDLEIVEALVRDQSVFCLPGKCFNIENFFRIVLTIPERQMMEACERIREFCITHATPKNAAIANFQSRIAAECRMDESRNSFSSSSSSGIASSSASSSDSEDISFDLEKIRLTQEKRNLSKRRYVGKRPNPMLRRETFTRLV